MAFPQVRLVMRPGFTYPTIADFCRSEDSGSIGYDGIVMGPSCIVNGDLKYGAHKKYGVRDHHGRGGNRLVDPATCEQTAQDIIDGTYEQHFSDGLIAVGNNCDEDMLFVWALLKNPQFLVPTPHPLLLSMLRLEGEMDRYNGVCPHEMNLERLQQLAWITRGYFEFKRGGGVERANPQEYVDVLEEGSERLVAYLNGKGHSETLDLRCRFEHVDDFLPIVEERGQHARLGVWIRGHQVYIAKRSLACGRHWYGVVSFLPGLRLDTYGIADALNAAEGLCSSRSDEMLPHQQWGGSSHMVCSPWIVGSNLTDHQVRGLVMQKIGHFSGKYAAVTR